MKNAHLDLNRRDGAFVNWWTYQGSGMLTLSNRSAHEIQPIFSMGSQTQPFVI